MEDRHEARACSSRRLRRSGSSEEVCAMDSKTVRTIGKYLKALRIDNDYSDEERRFYMNINNFPCLLNLYGSAVEFSVIYGDRVIRDEETDKAKIVLFDIGRNIACGQFDIMIGSNDRKPHPVFQLAVPTELIRSAADLKHIAVMAISTAAGVRDRIEGITERRALAPF